MDLIAFFDTIHESHFTSHLKKIKTITIKIKIKIKTKTITIKIKHQLKILLRD